MGRKQNTNNQIKKVSKIISLKSLATNIGNKKMKTHFRVINRVSRIEQTLNASEVARFFKLNSIKEYAISTVKPIEEKVLDTFIISGISVVFVICITKIIMQWI